MNKTEIISELARRNEIEISAAEKFLNSLEDLIIEKLQSGEEVAITGFGSFLAKERHARMGVNPRNPSEKIQIPAVTVPKFKAGKTLKDALKNKE
jgi:DNA-binding protein HU-beta